MWGGFIQKSTITDTWCVASNSSVYLSVWRSYFSILHVIIIHVLYITIISNICNNSKIIIKIMQGWPKLG